MFVYKLYDIETGDIALYATKEKAKEQLWELYVNSEYYETDTGEIKCSIKEEFDFEDMISDVGHVEAVEVIL
ncbi:hypothetical protein IJD44_00875 [bacterium]|nr:hypothetical protein [bacterium]